MKKLISVFLTLALCSMMVFAVAEGFSPVGTWYIFDAVTEGREIKIVDPEAITVVFNDDGSLFMKAGSLGEGNQGTWTVTENAVEMTVNEETQSFAIDGEKLVYDLGATRINLSRIPGEVTELPAVVAVESADAFDGAYVPFAQLTYGMYVEMTAEETAAYGKMVLKDGKLSIYYNEIKGNPDAVYNLTFADGALNGEDNTMIPTTMKFSLLENGSLLYEAIMDWGGAKMEMGIIYVPAAE